MITKECLVCRNAIVIKFHKHTRGKNSTLLKGYCVHHYTYFSYQLCDNVDYDILTLSKCDDWRSFHKFYK